MSCHAPPGISPLWRPLLILPDPAQREEIARVWPEAPMAAAEYLSATRIQEELARQSANLLILDASTAPAAALETLRHLAAPGLSIPVVTVHRAGDSESVLHARRQGAADFLTQPVTPDQLQAVLAKLPPPPAAAASHRSRVIAIMPGSGSCGASTLACAIAQAWRRSCKQRVLLADLDRFTGSLAFLLKLRPSWSFVDALTRGADLDADVWNGLVYQARDLQILLAPEKPDPALEELRDATPLLRFARQHYDLIVADCERGADAWALSIARAADSLILVARPEPASLASTRLLLQGLTDQGISRDKVLLVVNQHGKSTPLSREAIESGVGHPIAQLVPADLATVHRALMEGSPVPGSSGIGRAVDALLPSLAGAPEVPLAKPCTIGLSSLLSFFSRR